MVILSFCQVVIIFWFICTISSVHKLKGKSATIWMDLSFLSLDYSSGRGTRERERESQGPRLGEEPEDFSNSLFPLTNQTYS